MSANTHSWPNAATANVLPILDLSDFSAGNAQRRAAFVTHLRETAHHIGFFYLRNYGVSQVQIDAVLQTARDFFALPQEKKQALHMHNSPHFRG